MHSRKGVVMSASGFLLALALFSRLRTSLSLAALNPDDPKDFGQLKRAREHLDTCDWLERRPKSILF